MKIHSTYELKKGQLSNGSFSVGTGSEVILIIGSCRSVPYFNYLAYWNEINGNRFTIHYIDPFNWNWDLYENRIDYEAKINSLELDPYILNLLKSTSIYIHEYYQNFGMFNTKNIYNFGLDPKVDACIPNFNDVFCLANDLFTFDESIRNEIKADYSVIGKLSLTTESRIKETSEKNLSKFYEVCGLSSFPEFEEIFKSNYKTTRYFWTYNHVASPFTLTIYKLLNDKFLKLHFSDQYLSKISEVDMYANNYTHLTEYDDYQWNEKVKPLKEKL